MRALHLVAALVSLATWASVARAEDPELARARALWNEAGRLERRGDFHGAAEKLSDAIAIRDTPHLRYALGWALEHDGRLAEARSAYDLAERRARGSAEDVARLARRRRADIDARTSAPLLETPSAPTPTPTPLRVVAPAPRPPAPERSGPRVLPWAFVGTGAALAVGSVALVAASLSDTRARDAALREWCSATACTGGREATVPETAQAASLRAEAERAASAGNAKQTAAAVVGVTAVVGLTVGTVLLLRGERSAIAVGAAPTPGGAFATGSLRF